jgi:hypothetical protein
MDWIYRHLRFGPSDMVCSMLVKEVRIGTNRPQRFDPDSLKVESDKWRGLQENDKGGSDNRNYGTGRRLPM